MKTLKLLSLSLFASLLVNTSSAQQELQFSQVNNLDMLIANIFGVQCEGVSNVTQSPIMQAFGRFENGGVIGLNSGLVLSTGLVFNTGQPYQVFNSTNFGMPGDMDITNYGYMNGVNPLNFDACYVEFDFTPQMTDTISFTYILASEEYPEYSNTSYTDRFLFLVSENGGAYQNIAFLPGTNQAVEINSVNQIVNPQYYHDNAFGPASMYFVYDGYTVPFEAQFYAQVGSTYHIKLVIADVDDHIYDSAIFLNEQESFNEISGDLEVNGSPAAGTLEIFNYVSPDPTLAIPVYSEVITNGSFNTDSLPTGMYHVRFTPDPVLFPGVAPLYFTDGQTWVDAEAIGLPCFLDYANINSTSVNGMSGTGAISGTIVIDTTFLKSTSLPFEDAIVKLFDTDDNFVAYTRSDAAGYYQFNQLAAGDYYILLDVPYIPQLSVHDISIGNDQIMNGADFSIETTGIVAEDNLILGVEEATSSLFSVHPNPVKDELFISVKSGQHDYQLVNLDGRVVRSGQLVAGTQSIHLSDIPQGTYILQTGDSEFIRIIKSH